MHAQLGFNTHVVPWTPPGVIDKAEPEVSSEH